MCIFQQWLLLITGLFTLRWICTTVTHVVEEMVKSTCYCVMDVMMPSTLTASYHHCLRYLKGTGGVQNVYNRYVQIGCFESIGTHRFHSYLKIFLNSLQYGRLMNVTVYKNCYKDTLLKIRLTVFLLWKSLCWTWIRPWFLYSFCIQLTMKDRRRDQSSSWNYKTNMSTTFIYRHAVSHWIPTGLSSLKESFLCSHLERWQITSRAIISTCQYM